MIPEKIPPVRLLTGLEKAAIFMLSLSEDQVKKVFEKLEEYEVLELSQAMMTLGVVKARDVENIYHEFLQNFSSGGDLVGSLATTEQLLLKFFDKNRVKAIMEEIQGPSGRNMWEKLNNVNESILANYVKNEYPQTAAVILSHIKPSHSAKVFALLPQNLAMDIMARMMKIDTVQREILDHVEHTLKTEFISTLSKAPKKDPFQLIAEVFNAFDRGTEGRFMEALESKDSQAAEKVKSLMFTFNDLLKMDAAGAQTLIREIDKNRLALALKGANDDMKKLFLGNMSERAGKLLKEDMQAMGMVRLKDVDEAQLEIVLKAKDLIQKGDITIVISGDEEGEMIE